MGNKNMEINLEKTKKAMDEKKYLYFEYTDRSGKNSNRKIEPYRLVLKESHWYLQGG